MPDVPSFKASIGKAGEETGGWNLLQRLQIFLSVVLLQYGYHLLHTLLPLKVCQRRSLRSVANTHLLANSSSL